MFARHISGEHDLWHYLYFFAFLKYKSHAIKRQRKALKRAREMGDDETRERRRYLSQLSDDQNDSTPSPESREHGWRPSLRFTHVQREIFKKINSGNEVRIRISVPSYPLC